MAETLLGRSSHLDRSIRYTLACWPRLLDVHQAALYCSVGEQTIRDWVLDQLLRPVEMPGSALRDKQGQMISKPSRRKIGKILLDRLDIDLFISIRKAGA